jgi:hypothetical protein
MDYSNFSVAEVAEAVTGIVNNVSLKKQSALSRT